MAPTREPDLVGDLQGSVTDSASRDQELKMTDGSDNRDTQLAYESGRQAAISGSEARPGCPTNARGRAYMRGFTDGASERGWHQQQADALATRRW